MPASATAQPGSVVITGASSGLGRALAIGLAAQGHASRTPLRLWLTGRNGARLSETAERCAALGAEVATATIDITDAARVSEWILACDGTAPLDMVIANAGRSAGTGDGPESREQTGTLIETNIGGVVNTVLPAVARMRLRRHGHIVIVSSLAARLPFPSTPTYSASKAFVRNWGLALRVDLTRDGVSLTVVSPGYIATPMTANNDFKMPFLLSADQAATTILRRLGRSPPEIAFPRGAVAALRILSLLPVGLFGQVMSRRPRKRALPIR